MAVSIRVMAVLDIAAGTVGAARPRAGAGLTAAATAVVAAIAVDTLTARTLATAVAGLALLLLRGAGGPVTPGPGGSIALTVVGAGGAALRAGTTIIPAILCNER